jgi:hypothetical protein
MCLSFNLSWTDRFVLVLIQVELIQIECSKCIRSIWTKTNTNLLHSNSISSINRKTRMISRLELFFPVVIMIAHPPDRRLELFFPVVILPLLSIETLAHLLHVGWRNLPTLRVGWRNFFSSCAVVTVLVMAGNWFWYLCT